MKQLQVLGARIEANLAVIDQGWVFVGDYLGKIRDGKLYQPLSFANYLKSKKWKARGFQINSRRRADQLIKAAKIRIQLGEKKISQLPNESQAAELAKLPEKQREEIWKETLREATANGKQPRAKAIKKIAAGRNKTDVSKTSGTSPPKYLLEVCCAIQDALKIKKAINNIGKADITPAGNKIKFIGTPKQVGACTANVAESLPEFVADDFRLIVRRAS